jgi:hypothetical protein
MINLLVTFAQQVTSSFMYQEAMGQVAVQGPCIDKVSGRD